jgi:hypothetical protein
VDTTSVGAACRITLLEQLTGRSFEDWKGGTGRGPFAARQPSEDGPDPRPRP